RIDIAELFFEIVTFTAADRAHQLADFFDEPQQRTLGAAVAITFEVEVLDQPLERACFGKSPGGHSWLSFLTVISTTSSRKPSSPASCSIEPSSMFMNMLVWRGECCGSNSSKPSA